jgi:hypothetical protein
VNALWAWFAALACRREEKRALAVAVIVFAALQAALWSAADPFTPERAPAARHILELAAAIWTAALAPASLLFALIRHLGRRARGRRPAREA